jgi:hypothetical protein
MLRTNTSFSFTTRLCITSGIETEKSIYDTNNSTVAIVTWFRTLCGQCSGNNLTKNDRLTATAMASTKITMPLITVFLLLYKNIKAYDLQSNRLQSYVIYLKQPKKKLQFQ